MTHKTLRKARWFWEDYVGVQWKNVKVANTGEGLGAYAYIQGKNSKSQYKPKSLFYHYQVDGIDSSKHKLDKVTFVLVIRKFNPKENDYPTLKVFYGDNNAPYRKTPIKTISTFKKLKNQYDYDNYTLEYDLTGVSIAQLKNIIVEVDWKKSKVASKSTISVNRGRLEVDYSLQNPKWGLYSSLNKTDATTDEKVAWKLTVKNTGYCASEYVTLNLPKNVTVASSTGNGAYDNTTKRWSFNNICKGKSVTRTFYLKSDTVGSKTVKATNSSSYVANKTITDTINFTKYDPPTPPIRNDEITYTFYDTFESEEYQYFDIRIDGFNENHSSDRACYTLSTSNNITLYNPIYSYAELIGENINVVRIYHRQLDNTLCLVIDPSEDFVANVRLYMYCSDDTDGTITINDGVSDFVGSFDILPKRGNSFLVDESISRDKTYVQNSVNIGSPTVWTVNAKPHRHNFFDERKDLMEIEIEKEFAYIGVIPLIRCHKADVTATSKNTLIENRYLNRAYLGKKGDYSEDIKMTLRIPWYDVATLQGLCEMDKPIPIDTIPNRADGDPLNHRGWAEIYEVGNIKKINDMLYECDVGVTYLTHDILTRFNITEAKKITEANIKYYLSLIHDYNGDILDLFQLNYYEFWTTLEDANGDKVGSYSIEPNTSLKLSRDLNKYSTYDIIWRNTLPSLMSEDYDGNWEMALRVLNKTTRDTLFEHSYNNFQHYDFTNQYAVNTANAETKVLDSSNNYQTLNYQKINLGFDGLAPLIEDNKEPTHFNTMENVVITDITDKFEIFLLDSENVGISNQVVNVKVVGDDDFTDSFSVVSDKYGRVLFDVLWGNGNYKVDLAFDETKDYRSCNYSTDVIIQLDDIEYHFTYPTNTPTYLNNGNAFICNILDSSNNGVANITCHYSWKTVGGDYGHEEIVESYGDGNVRIPITRPTGSHILRVNFKGYTSGANVYQPCQFETQINTLWDKVDAVIEADDVVLMQGDSEKLYSVILRDKVSDGVMANENVKFAFYNNDETFLLDATTNSYGVASVPLYLKGGAWKVDVSYNGGDNHNPVVETRTVTVTNFEQIGTYVVCEDMTLNEDKLLDGSQDYFKFYLRDEYNNAVIREPVNVKIKDNTGTNTYIDTVFSTRSDGSVTVPFISHSENVFVEIAYNGSVKYSASSNYCTLSFETILNKTAQSLSKVTEQVIEIGTGELKDEDVIKLTIGSTVQTSFDSDYCIVHSIDNERITSDDYMMDEWIENGWGVSNNALPKGKYRVTIFQKGDDTKYSICRTFDITTVNDGRIRFLNWIQYQGLDTGLEELTHEYLNDATKVDDYAHIRFKFNFWIPNDTLVTVKSGYVNSSSYSKQYKTVTKETTDEDGKRISYFDIYGVLTSEATWHFDFDGNTSLRSFNWDYELTASATSKSAITVAQTGFASNNETYQDLKININNSNGTITYDDGYYIIKLFNNETYEELYYYSYIYNNLKPSTIQFPLTKSIKESGNNWTMEIFVNHDATHKCGYLTANGRITTDTVITLPTTTIFVDSNEYIQLGDSVTFTTNGFNY